MKKQLTGFGFSLLIVIAVAFAAFTPQEKNKSNQKKKEQGQPMKEKKNNQGRNDVKNNNGNNNDRDNNNHNDDKDRDGKGNNGKNDDNKNNGNNDRDNSYDWNTQTFKDRNKIRNKDKVTICHKFNRNNEPGVAIRVSSNALKAHMSHGDVMGDCPSVKDGRYSDIFMRKRNDYYDNMQQGQEQVLYSRSILNYAMTRLVNSRSQLATYQNNNMPKADIERKQAIVLELEQNVSLLETLVGAAVTMLVNKLQ